MREIKFRAWHIPESKMYFRAYQKLFHVLLCEDDGTPEGRGKPVLRARFGDCVLMETASVTDRNGREVFEGDVVRIRAGGRVAEGVFESVPDTFRSRRLHPLHELCERHGVRAGDPGLELEVVGNKFERGPVLP